MDTNSILLTYKGKVLVTLIEHPPFDKEKNIYRFISAKKSSSLSSEDAIIKEVARETGIQLKKVEFVTSFSYNDSKKSFYHARLTDYEVNHLERSEGKIIAFYTVKELEILQVPLSVKLFLSKNRNLLEKIPAN